MKDEEEEISEQELRELMGSAACSSIGFDPRRETPKEKREFAKRRRESFDEHAPRTALKIANAQCTMQNAKFPRWAKRDLFGQFWREGELVILTGASGAGKSILAMQVAETAARLNSTDGGQLAMDNDEPEETDHPLSAVNCQFPRVLYIDLERSEKQRVERYSYNDGSRTRRYEFADGFEWMDVADFGWMHSKYNGSVTRFYVASVMEAIRDREPDVVVIDNLTYLMRARCRSEDVLTLMKSLRRIVNDNGISIMLLAHSNRRLSDGRLTYPDGLELADRVFALCQSTMGPAFRYVKTMSPASEVIDGVAAFEMVLSRGPIHHPALPGTPPKQGGELDGGEEFVGFEFMGPMDEEDHRRDYRVYAKTVKALVRQAEERYGLRSRPVNIEQRKVNSDAVRSPGRLCAIQSIQ